MYEKILVALDGSELAQVALPYAEELAGKMASEVTLAHVVQPPERGTGNLRKTYLEWIAQLTKQLAERYTQAAGAKGIKVKTTILTGDPPDRIVRYADKEDISLIIMSTHGLTGIRRWALGSTAREVARATARPIMLIRARGAIHDVRKKGILKKVLVPLDGSKEAEAVVPYIEELAAKLGAEVVLLLVVPMGYHTLTAEGYEYAVYPENQMASDKAFAKDYLDKVCARLKKSGVVAISEVKFGPTADEIIDFADKTGADLVAMSTHGRSGIGRWVFGSVAERVLHDGHTPLLLVRSPGAITR